MGSILVFGAGISGQSVCRLAIGMGNEVVLVDERDPSCWNLGPDLEKVLARENRYQERQAHHLFCEKNNLLVLSPGISRVHPLVQMALDNGLEVVSEIEYGHRALVSGGWEYKNSEKKIPPIIAITGSNGKTTTVTLLTHILRSMGKEVFLGGNIGTPLCDMVRESSQKGEFCFDYIVLELSSFQLESMSTFHPHIALILNLEMNHGERYPDLETYAKAKFHISDRLGKEDFFFFPQKPEFFGIWGKNLGCHKGGLDPDSLLKEIGQHDWAQDFSLPGKHNRLNLACAHLIIKTLGINCETEVWKKALQNFSGVEHRLELLPQRRWKKKIFNDAKSTNFSATKTALEAFRPDERLALVFGGKARGGDLSSEDELFLLDRCSHIFLIGETTDQYFQRLVASGGSAKNIFALYSLENLIDMLDRDSKKVTEDFEVLLFSPGHPSFDQFNNYSHRGSVFKKLIAKSE